MQPARRGEVHRVTGETDVQVRLDLDGSGACTVSTGVPFLDHMLHQISSHGLIDLDIQASGDTYRLSTAGRADQPGGGSAAARRARW